MFSSKPINCLLVLDKYMNEFNNISEITKWLKRLKTNVEEEDCDNKHKRNCLLYINALTQLIDIYADNCKDTGVNMNDIMKLINGTTVVKAAIEISANLIEYKKEITSILNISQSIPLNLRNELEALYKDICDILILRECIEKKLVDLQKSRAEVESIIASLKSKHLEIISKIDTGNLCLCHESLSALHDILSTTLKIESVSRLKLSRIINLIKIILNEEAEEKNVLDRLISQRELFIAEFKKIDNSNKSTIVPSLTPQNTQKITHILSKLDINQSINNKTELRTLIEKIFVDCYINTNKFLYNLDF